jgi:hypothetical protein
MTADRSLASSFGFGVGAVLLLTGCPSDPTPITSDSETSGSSTGDPDSSTTLPPDPDTSSSTTAPDPDTGSSTTAPDPDTSTGPASDCGNEMLDAGEVCDGSELDGATCITEGFDAGELGCRADCGDYDRGGCSSFTCGNNITDPGEVCDGTDHGGVTCEGMGFDSGTPVCSNDCQELDIGECGTCGNVVVDGDEVCDGIVLFGQTCESQGFDTGQLACAGDCLTYDTAQCITCGNDIIDGVEPCDGVDLGGATCVSEGYVGGSLACAEDCLDFDITSCNTCGNALIEPGEGCDGLNLNGQTCASIGLEGGDLSCTVGCQYDFSACDIAGIPFGNDGSYSGFALTPGVLPCDDISGTGTPTGLTDDSQTQVNLGFTMPFYDGLFTQISISSNGHVYFEPPDFTSLSGVCPPSDTFSTADEYFFSVFWDDLNPGAAGDVYYQTLGAAGNQRFVVQWDVPFFGGDIGDLLRVQTVLHESGGIDACYVDTTSAADFGNNGGGAAAGIMRDSVTGFSYSCSTPDLTAGLLLMYLPV